MSVVATLARRPTKDDHANPIAARFTDSVRAVPCDLLAGGLADSLPGSVNGRSWAEDQPRLSRDGDTIGWPYRHTVVT